MCVRVRRMLLLSRAVALVGRDELGPFDFCFPCHKSALLRLLVNKVTARMPARFLLCRVDRESRAYYRMACMRALASDLCFRCAMVFFRSCSLRFVFCCRESTSSLNCIDNIFLLYSHIADLC